MPAPTRFARSFRLIGLLSCAFAALQACGGRSDTEDYLFDGAPSGGTASNAGSNVGASGGTLPGGKAGTSSTGAVTGTGGSGVVQAGASSVAGSAAGGTPATGGVSQGGMAQGGVSQGGANVAGNPPVGGQPGSAITCGAQVCDSQSESCCATLGGFGCIPLGQSCAGATLDCGASSDCAGNDVCCLQIVGNASVGSSCKNNCAGMGPGRERQLCTTDQECQGNRRCRDTVFGISVCTRS